MPAALPSRTLPYPRGAVSCACFLIPAGPCTPLVFIACALDRSGTATGRAPLLSGTLWPLSYNPKLMLAAERPTPGVSNPSDLRPKHSLRARECASRGTPWRSSPQAPPLVRGRHPVPLNDARRRANAVHAVCTDCETWSERRGLNPRPPHPQRGALPLSYVLTRGMKMAEHRGIEPLFPDGQSGVLDR